MAKYNIKNGKTILNTTGNIKYESHSYIKEKLIKQKITENKLEKKDIDNDPSVQEIYYKFMHSIQPNMNFYDIALYLHKKYDLGKICYTKSQNSNYKKTIKNDKIYDEIRKSKLDKIELNKEKLLKLKIEYQTIDSTTKKVINKTIRIFATDKSLKLLKNENIEQYFIDGTYHCVPHSIESSYFNRF